MKISYILSDAASANVIEALEQQLKLVKECEDWRRVRGIPSLAYEIEVKT